MISGQHQVRIRSFQRVRQGSVPEGHVRLGGPCSSSQSFSIVPESHVSHETAGPTWSKLVKGAFPTRQIGNGERDHFERGVITGGNSRLSDSLESLEKTQRVTQKANGRIRLCFHSLGFSRTSRISKISRKWTFLKEPFFKRPLFPNPSKVQQNDDHIIKVCSCWADPGIQWKKAPRAMRAMRGKTLETVPFQPYFGCTKSFLKVLSTNTAKQREL